MMNKLIAKLKNEEANSMVENVIILPLIFIIIYAMILTCFIVHDRSTLEAAAKRGTIYAAHCISDPNYAMILQNSGNSGGVLDVSVAVDDNGNGYDFKNVGTNVQAYRYILKSGNEIEDQVKNEVKKIVEKTRIPWRKIEIDDIDYKATNKLYYQDVSLTIDASYPIPEFFGAFGLDTEYEYKVTAKMTVNDPDEFIRNADMVVDLITDVDNATGGHLGNATKKISELASKILDWLP